MSHKFYPTNKEVMGRSLSSSTRAGEYVRQLTGYEAFIPKPLPPKPAVKIEEDLRTLLSQADRALGKLDVAVKMLPNPNLFVSMSVRREAVLSSQIEGTQSSLQDLLAAEAEISVPNLPSDVAEVVNYVIAMEHGLNRLADLPISVRLICEIHAELLRGVRGSNLSPGELRTSQNWIGPPGSTLKDATFVPPPPHEVGDALAQLETFIHTDTSLPLLLKIGLVHVQFETIHPFLDGNGRVGRLLITFLLCERKLLPKPVLYLSYFFNKNRRQYYDELQSVHNHGTWENWLRFFLQGIIEVSEQATFTAQKIFEMREAFRKTVTENFGQVAANGYRVLDYLYDKRPIVSVGDVEQLNKTSYVTANKLVARLVDTGILREITGRSRNRRFIYRGYIDLFDDSKETAKGNFAVSPSCPAETSKPYA